jgi:hypothetical protein
MPGTALPERIYGLTVADGRRSVRPGEEIRLRFRARATRAAAPAVRATIAIPTGWTALDPVEGELLPCDGGEHGIELRARAETADEGEAGAFQVALALPDGMLGSNVVRIAVRGRPRFEPPGSVVRVEPGPDPGIVRAVATFANTGDAVARSARVIVPAPAGFSALAAPEWMGDIVPGASYEHAVCFQATAPAADTVTIAGTCISFSGGTAVLAPSAPFPLVPTLLPPGVTVARSATRLDVTVRIENAGLAPACDVPVRIAFPPGWRALTGATTIDGAPAAATVRGGAFTVAVPFVAARGGAVLLRAFAATRAPRDGGDVTVTCGEHEIHAPAGPPLRRSAQLDARVAGAAVRVVAWNDGETDEALALHAGDEIVGRLQLRAGRSATTIFPLPAWQGDADATVAVHAMGADGAALGSCTFVLRPLAPDMAEPAQPTPAAAAPVAALALEWSAPPQAEPGVPFDVQLRCRFTAPVADVAIRPRFAAARYVAGSTRVNGHIVVDGDAPPLLRAAGLRCYDVAAGGTVEVRWSLLPDGSGDVVPAARVDADGSEHESDGPVVAVAAPAPFACRPEGLPFHLDAAVLAPATGIVFAVRLDAQRRAALARMLRALRGSGIAAHVPLVAALFPDTAGSDDPALAHALAVAGRAIRMTYERLFVKLRIPGYDVAPHDLEDAAARSAVLDLFDVAARATPVAGAAPALGVAIDRARARDVRERLAHAPLGGLDAIAAAAALLPRAGTDPAAGALAAYVALLADELDAARSLGQDAFAAFLAMHANPALDRACAAAVAALA